VILHVLTSEASEFVLSIKHHLMNQETQSGKTMLDTLWFLKERDCKVRVFFSACALFSTHCCCHCWCGIDLHCVIPWNKVLLRLVARQDFSSIIGRISLLLHS